MRGSHRFHLWSSTVSCTAQAWVKEMAAFVKSIAPKQMVGIGDEGFATFINDADSQSLVDSNPGVCFRRPASAAFELVTFNSGIIPLPLL